MAAGSWCLPRPSLATSSHLASGAVTRVCSERSLAYPSIAGPLLGGFLVDNFSWHWVFYVNLPIGLLSLGVTALALPTTSSPRRARVDWAGAALLALATTALVLLASLGGTRFAWSSVPIIGLGVVAVLAGVAFGQVER